ncbi:MAG: sulfatase-like hydrolase/transferase [Spirochaetota bacterium]
MSPERPNLLFIMADQLRADALACCGPAPARTPNLDALAAGGTLFSQCRTVSPICMPARAALLSGVYPHQLGIWNNDPFTFPSAAPNWVKTLRTAGYRTSVIGKTHYYPYDGSVPDMRQAEPLISSYGYDDVDEIPGPRVSGRLLSHMTALWRDRGYLDGVRGDLESRYAGNHAMARESVLPLELYPDVYVGQQAEAYLKAYDRPEPFFCFVSFGGPHDPWDCPREYAAQFDGVTVQPALKAFVDACPDRPRGVWDEGPHHPPFSAADVEAIRRNYAGKVSLIDYQIGNVLKALATTGRLDNTVIIFSSDHGEMNGDHGRLYKQNFLESSVLVPLIARIPGRLASRSDALIELQDIGPTMLELAGLEPGYPQCGKSFANLIGDKESHSHNHRSIVFSEYNREIMAFDGRWKLVVNPRSEPYLLFDLASDPAESINLASCGKWKAEESRLVHAIEQFVERNKFRV